LQEEEGIIEIHGEYFIDIAGLLVMYLETAGIYIGQIYIEGTDV
jgi:hypothetical protein